jgi:hypothetical protein
MHACLKGRTPATIALVALAAGALAPGFLVAQPRQPTIDQVVWLTGCWHGSSPGREYREQWGKLAGGMMMGTSQTVRDGKTVEYEFLQILAAEDGVYYLARPSGQKEAAFKLIEVTPQSAIFENKQHDFPQRILYRLGAAGSLVARIEGVENGAARGVDFPMTREPCE